MEVIKGNSSCFLLSSCLTCYPTMKVKTICRGAFSELHSVRTHNNILFKEKHISQVLLRGFCVSVSNRNSAMSGDRTVDWIRLLCWVQRDLLRCRGTLPSNSARGNTRARAVSHAMRAAISRPGVTPSLRQLQNSHHSRQLRLSGQLIGAMVSFNY